MAAQKQAQKEKKLPTRRCVGCSEHRAKNELIRVVRTPQGEVVLDRTGKKNGRGAYLCPDPACLKKAVKSGRLGTNLSCEVIRFILTQWNCWFHLMQALEKEITGSEV